MALMVRGTLWFGLYIFLALLPLATAVISNPNRGQGPLIREIAVGAGFVGLALMALEFALISRVKTVGSSGNAPGAEPALTTTASGVAPSVRDRSTPPPRTTTSAGPPAWESSLNR